ncbi:DciA family protein [Streptomyces sp. NPDC020379]|uniref:DciA family protein n=1 Tax=Streptomyces sp. NPDC020379 TaxID=3365071 RepID=UPI0037A3209C
MHQSDSLSSTALHGSAPRPEVDPARIALRNARADARYRWSPARGVRALPRHRRRSPPVVLKTVVEELAARMGQGVLLKATLFAHWYEVVGSLADHISVVAFDQGRGELVLRADSKAWTTQIQILAPVLVQHLNARMADEVVRSVRVLAHGPARPPRPAAEIWSDGKGAPPALRPAARVAGPPPVDAAVEAADERQARCLPREPTGRFSGSVRGMLPDDAGFRGRRASLDAVLVRARLRACAEQRQKT